MLEFYVEGVLVTSAGGLKKQKSALPDPARPYSSAQPSLRDTAQPAFAIKDTVSSDEVKVRLDPSRLFGRS